MANPKYIDESLLPAQVPDEDEESSKKVSKKAYSFRCDETLLDEMNKYAELEGITLPQLLSGIMADFINSKTLTNTYLTEFEGMYINIPSNADGKKSFEYEIRYIMNNLDVWTAEYGYVSKNGLHHGIMHEGIDFIVIPETLHGHKLSDVYKVGLHVDYSLNLNNIPKCLYCIYLTVDMTGLIEYEVISWITAMNKLKAVGRYDLISYGNEIKKKLEALYNDYIKDEGMYDVEMMWDMAYGRLLKIAEDYNTGAILPASNSIDNIEYTAIVKQLPDNYDLINKLIKENAKYKKALKGMDETVKKLDELEAINKKWDELSNEIDDIKCRQKAWDELKNNPESDDES